MEDNTRATKDNIPTLKEIFNIAKPYKKRWGSTIILSLIGMIFHTQIPLCIQYMISGIINSSKTHLWVGFGWLISVLVINSVISYYRLNYGNFQLFSNILKDLREKVVKKSLDHSYTFIDSHKSGDLVATGTVDVLRLTDFLAFEFPLVLMFIGQIITISIILLLISPILVLVLVCFFPWMILIVTLYRKKIHPITFEQRNIFGKLSSRLQQNIAGIQLVKIFHNEFWESEKFDLVNKEYTESSWRVAKLSSFTHPLIDFVWEIARLILIGLGGYLVIYTVDNLGIFGNLNITLDQMIAFIPALDMFLWPITFLSWVGGEYGRIQAAYKRLKVISDEPIDITQKENAIKLPELNGQITLKNVTFGYDPLKPVIKDITMEIPAGSKIALLGATGSGKSTIINLINRFYDTQNGQIILDNKYDIKDVDLDTYINQIGIVAQDPFLFKQSFKENLTHGLKNYNMEDVIDACKTAQIHDFIISKADGYDTLVGERGVTLSGGQKQRITIARALIRRPKILIFDAATSSVDVDTEHDILVKLKSVFKQCTTIIITQRLSTVHNADKIYVFEKGRIIEEGTHEELLKLNKSYAYLYKTVTYSPIASMNNFSGGSKNGK